MSTAIICLIIVIICVFGIRSYAKRLTHGCCGGGDVEKRIKPTDRNPANYPYVKTMEITGMTCGNCAKRIENAFNKREGMWAEVDSAKGFATIRMKQETGNEELRKIVESLGYSVAAFI